MAEKYEPLKFETTKDIKIPKKIIDQVIGQDDAVAVVQKAAKQRRHVLLIGEPGTGKSMLGIALAELLPKENLVDILSFANPNDEQAPLIRTVPGGKGRELVAQAKMENQGFFKGYNLLIMAILVVSFIAPWWAFNHYSAIEGGSRLLGGLMFVAFFLGSMLFFVAVAIFFNVNRRQDAKGRIPKVIVDNFDKKQSQFFDATGSHAGALLGDVLHDPFQSGGLGTPAHERVVAGLIHKAHLGVLFVDEIATLSRYTQQELLTAMQEGKFTITGHSARSAGAMVRTEPVPCNFILIAAGNLETLKHMHPALRSRIRGYGYEIYMKDTIEDTPANRDKIAVFIAQEVAKDKKIPAFSAAAVERIITEARRMANRKGHLTLRFRELGGMIRAAGDFAVEQKAELVLPEHIEKAMGFAKMLEQQIIDRYTESKREYEVIVTTGKRIGRVNGLAVFGTAGMIQPIEAEVTPGGKITEVVATGKLGEIAQESIKNVSAIVKKYFGDDIKNKHDIYVQFLQTYEGIEGDSASIAVATAIISALKQVPIKQDYVMTGSLSVSGEVLPVGGVTAKVEAAIKAGVKKVIVPKANLKDIVIKAEELKKIRIIPVERIQEVLSEVMDWSGKKALLNQIKKAHPM